MRSPAKSCATPKKRQACLDLARNHLRFEPQLAQAVQQQGGIGRIARGTRARGADAHGPKGMRLVHKHATRGEHTLDGRLAKAARRVHASPKSVISVCLDDSTIAPASTCANTSRDDTVPRSIAATL